MIKLLGNINSISRFIFELCCIVCILYWGFSLKKFGILKYIIGVLASLIIIVTWAILGAPNSPNKLNDTYRLILEIGIFTISIIALYRAGSKKLALIFAILLTINTLLIYIL